MHKLLTLVALLALPLAASGQTPTPCSSVAGNACASPDTTCSETVQSATQTTCGGGSDTVNPSTLLDSLRSYYTMDETSGDRFDSVGGLTLTANGTGGVGSVAGKLGNAADFELTEGDYLVNTANTTADTNITICGWFRPESTAAVSEFFSLGAGGNFSARANTTVLQFVSQAFGQTFNYTGGADVAAGTWYHICAWYDADNNRVGMSKNAVIADAAASGANGAGTDIFIGAREATPTSPTDGSIDEVGIWSRILTQTEITCLYGGGTPPAYPFTGICGQMAANELLDGLTLYASLDEASGTRVDSVDSHDFTPFGAPTAETGILGNAVGLTGTDCGSGSCTAGDEFRTASASDLQTGSIDFSVSVWFYIDADSPAANRAIVAKSTEWFCRLNGSDQANCYTNHELTLLWDPVLARDIWHHLFFKVEGTTAYMAIDGQTAISGAIPTPPILPTNEAVSIGAYFAGTGGFGIGRVDEFGFWRGRGLTTAESRCLWGQGSPPAYPFPDSAIPERLGVA